MIETRKIETKPCSRCGGEGKLWHFSHVRGGTCFKCGGAKEVRTKRGEAANNYLIALRSKRADALVPGDLVRESVGWNPSNSVTTFMTVASIEPLTMENATGWSIVDGQRTIPENHLKVELTHERHGGLGTTWPVDKMCRVACTAEFKAETLTKALDYQDTLTQSGTVKKSRTV